MSEGEGLRLCRPFCIYPHSDRSPDGSVIAAGGPVTSSMGTRKIPNGTLICQKGPVFPRWDPIWPRGLMFTGTCLPPPFPALKGLSWVGSPSKWQFGTLGLYLGRAASVLGKLAGRAGGLRGC